MHITRRHRRRGFAGTLGRGAGILSAAVILRAVLGCAVAAAKSPPSAPPESPEAAETGGAGREDAAELRDRIERLESMLDGITAAEEKQQAEAAKRPSVRFGGQVQGDWVYFGQGPASRASVGDLQDGAQFRRVRIGARGNAFEVLEYSLGVDFALASQPSYLDNYIEAHELPLLQNLRFGHFFEPFSLERVTQNFNNTFMERSLVDTFAPARNMGVMAYGTTDDQRQTWQIGTFRTNSDNTGNDSFDSGQALTLRRTWLPWYDEASDGRYYLHLGAAYSYRLADTDRVRFRNTPEIRKSQPVGSPSANPGTPPFAPIFVDTGFIPARNFQLFDPEFSLVHGPLSLQSEYAFAAVDQIAGPGLFFHGYMAQLSWFVTGEHRPYDRERGIQRRMEVTSPFFRVRTRSQGIQTGPGAWEIATRFSTINLNDQNVRGNKLTDFTAGLHWYLNPHARVKFNYIRAFLEDPSKGNSLTDIYGMRFDYDF